MLGNGLSQHEILKGIHLRIVLCTRQKTDSLQVEAARKIITAVSGGQNVRQDNLTFDAEAKMSNNIKLLSTKLRVKLIP